MGISCYNSSASCFFFINLLFFLKKKGKEKQQPEIGISCFGDKFPVVCSNVTNSKEYF